jgi:hypothetical protein
MLKIQNLGAVVKDYLRTYKPSFYFLIDVWWPAFDDPQNDDDHGRRKAHPKAPPLRKKIKKNHKTQNKRQQVLRESILWTPAPRGAKRNSELFRSE